jgi:hypothetical protein
MGMFSAPKMPKMPDVPAPPRVAVETDPDIEKRAKRRMAAQRKGRRSTLLADRTKTTNQITTQNLGGSSGNNYGSG